MALEDRDIFKAIFDRNVGQPIEFIMAQYEKARLLNKEIEKHDMDEAAVVCEAVEESAAIEEIPEDVPAPRKRITRRNFKVKPQDSITQDVIYCCICGEERQSLTAKHLANHDITVEEYKKLCGFPMNQPLMSGKRLEKSKEIIARAQQARLKKKALENQY